MRRKLVIAGLKNQDKRRLSVDGRLLILTMIVALSILFVQIAPFESNNDKLKYGMFENIEQILSDGSLSEEEEAFLLSLSCSEFKEFYGTNKSVCLYLLDENNEPVTKDGNRLIIGCESDEEGNPCTP